MKNSVVFLFGLVLFSLLIFSFLFVDRNFLFLNIYSDFIFLHKEITAFIFVILIVSFFAFYFYFIKNQNKISKNQLWKIILISIIISIFSYPAFLSYDIFNYALTAKVAFHYKENPYLLKPIEFIGDSWLPFTRATNKVALYGPLWVLLAGIPYLLSFGNYLMILINLKLLYALFFLGSVFFISRLTPQKREVILFALNPLIIIETFISGHNDITMIFLMLSSLYFFSQKKITIGSLLYVSSIFIKYSSLIALPVYGFIFINSLRKKKIDWPKVFTILFYCMFLVFVLSFIREEIYSWYAIWFLPFGFLSKNKKIVYFCLAFSISLLLGYVPYLLLQSYSKLEIYSKMGIIFLIPLVGYCFMYLKKKL